MSQRSKRKRADGSSSQPKFEQQSPQKRQQIRKKLRDLKEDTKNDADGDHVQQLANLNKNLRDVRNTREAVLDAQVLQMVAAQATKKMLSTAQGRVPWQSFDTFKQKLLTKLIESGDGDEVARLAPTTKRAWSGLGYLGASFMRTPSFPCFMYGPLSIDTTKVKRTQGVRMKKFDASNIVKATETLDSASEKKQDFSSEMIAGIYDNLQTWDKSNGGEHPELAPGLFELCINPKSFSQTVENFFHLSFVVGNGGAEIKHDPSDEPRVYAAEPPDQNDENSGSKKHIIFELSMDEWKDAIEVYGIKKCKYIPHREHEPE